MRGRSYTPSPPPPRGGYGRRGRSPSPRGRYGGGRSRDLPSRDLPTSLLVRNLRHDCRPDDLRRQFGQFGHLKDVYLPRDYYSGEPRGFGFVQFVDPADAAEAKYHMDGYVLLGRELTVVFAEENRKKPTQMRQRDRGTGRGSSRYDRGRSPPPRSSRYSRSPPPARHPRSRSRSPGYDSPPPKRRYSRSPSPPQEKRRDSRERSYTPPRHKYSRSPPMAGSRSRSQSPNAGGGRSPGPIPVRGRSRSRSPPVENYARDNGGDRSPSQ